MDPLEKEARLWFYSRNVDLFISGQQGSSTRAPIALKHWAIVLDYMSIKNPSRINKRILYEANNEQGLLIAREVYHGEDEEADWKEKSGFKKKGMEMVTINEARAKLYCEEFNSRKIKYVATMDNCQRFVEEFLANLLPDSAISLPTTVKEVKCLFDGVSSASLNSLSNFGFPALINRMIGAGITETMVKEAIRGVNLNGFGKISLLAQSPIKEYMIQEGKQ